MQIKLLFIFVFIGLTAVSSAQNSITDSVFTLIYNQKYEAAKTLLESKHSEIDSTYFAVLDIDMSYWKNVSGPKNTNYKLFENHLQKYLSQTPDNENQKIIQLVALSYQLRYEIKRLQLFSAISTRKHALELFNELCPKAHKLSPNERELFELYQSMTTYFDYFMKPPFSKNKTQQMNASLRQMHQLTNSDQNIVKTLSSYFLGKIYLKYEKSPAKGAHCFDWLVANYPENAKFKELLEECKTHR